MGAGGTLTTAAANLVDGMEVLPHSNAKQWQGKREYCAPRDCWVPVRVTRTWYTGDIVSIEVEGHANYFGDGILTHNSFTGAVNVMQNLQVGWDLPLTKSWRFGVAIAATANLLLRSLGTELRVEGTTTQASYLEADMKAPDAVLCRTNAALIGEVIAEQAAGRRVALAGGERFRSDLAYLVTSAAKLQRQERQQHPLFVGMDTWAEVVEFVEEDQNAPTELAMLVKLVKEYGTHALSDAVEACKADASEADVTISTAHKAKGLEWERVRIADDFALIYPDGLRRKHDPDAEPSGPAEFMLAYVAVTRARVALDVGNLFADNPQSGIAELYKRYTKDAATRALAELHPELVPPKDNSPAPAPQSGTPAEVAEDPWGTAPTPAPAGVAVDGVAAHRRYMQGARRDVAFNLPQALLDGVLENQRRTGVAGTPHEMVAGLVAWALEAGADVGTVLRGK